MAKRDIGPGMTYFDLKDVLAQRAQDRTCPICVLSLRSVDRYLDTLLYESVNDPGIRREIRDARGFCNTHAAMLARKKDILGLAIIHRDLVRTVLGALEQARFRPSLRVTLARVSGLDRNALYPGVDELAESLSSQRLCPACAYQRRMEEVFINTLLRHLDDPAIRGPLEEVGLCLPHFRHALSHVHDTTTFQTLVDIERSALRRLAHELDELVRKHDYRFADEAREEEADAWLRALRLISGMEGLVT